MNGVNVGSVFFDVALNNRQFRRDIQNEGKFAEKSLGAVFGKIGKLALAAFSVRAITQFATSAINLASDLEEVQNVVDVTFGQGNQKIQEFATSSMTAFGLSELSAKQYMGTMGAMLKSMGLTSGAVETMSMDMAALAGDMASFYNLDTDEAFSKIRSGISGETEPLKQLGINMSVANMEAFALSQGINKSYNSMTQAEQALLRYNYLMSVTSDAQGDFTRTSNSWANQVRVLKLQWDSFKSALGSAFIAVLTPVIRGLNLLLGKLVTVANAFKSFVNLITGGKATQSASSGVSAIGAAAMEAGDQAAAGAKKAKGALAAFDELNTLSSGDSGGGGGATGSEFDFGDIAAENAVLEETSNKLDELKVKAKQFLDAFGLTAPFQSFVDTAKSEFDKIKEKAVSSWGSIRSSAQDAFSRVTEAIKPLIGPVGTLGAQIGEIFIVNLSSGIQAIFGIITRIVERVMEVFAAGVELVSSILKPIVERLVEFFNEHGEEIKTEIRETWAAIENIVGTAVDIISNIVLTVFGVISDFVNKHMDTILDIVSGAATILWNTIKTVLNLIQGDWKGAWDSIKIVFSTVWSGIKATMSTIGNFLSQTFTNAKNALKKVWNDILGVFKAPINTIIGWINKLIGAWNAINFKVPKLDLGPLGDFGGFSVGLPKIAQVPMLAKGGVVNQPTLAMIGEKGSEAVVPLENNTGWMDTMSSALRVDEMLALLKAILEALLSGKVVELDRKVVGQVIFDILESSFRSAGKTTLSV